MTTDFMSATDTDVAVIGGGLGGCIVAKCIADLGLRVCVVDRTADPLHDFRAEQIVGAQIDRLRSLGLIDAMSRDGILTDMTANARRGIVLDRTRVKQYGIAYRSMVLGARSALPDGTLRFGRVTGLETSSGAQTVHLADGGTLTARLVVVATGLLPHVLASLGIKSRMVSEAHSLTVGFDLALGDPRRADIVPLIYYGERVEDRLDYLALFWIGGTLRANLFAYQPRNGAWARDFVANPDEMLRVAMPGLAKVVGKTSVVAPILMRNNDIRVAEDVVRDGIVVIGDAFQTPCPAAGTGIDRILSDVDALARRLPLWFSSPGMGADKIAAFYADPAKRAFDAECIRIARYRRAVSTETGLSWRLHRRRVHLQRWLQRLTGPNVLSSVYGRLGQVADTVGLVADRKLPTGL